MTITATELRANPGRYLALAAKEDVFITQRGKVVAKLSNPFRNRLEVAEELFGSVPAGMTLEEARKDNIRNG